MGLVQEVLPSPSGSSDPTSASCCGSWTGSAPKDQAVEDREDRGVGANPERQRQHAPPLSRRAVAPGGLANASRKINACRCSTRDGAGLAWRDLSVHNRQGLLSQDKDHRLQLEGVYSGSADAISPSGDLDEASLRKVIDLFIEAGVNGVTALGVTGEVARFDDAEAAPRAGSVSSSTSTAGSGWSPERPRKGRASASAQPACEAGGSDRGDGEPAADAEAQFRGGRPSLHGARRSGRHRDRGPGLSADLRLCDGAGAARADRARDSRARTIKLEDPPTPFKTSRILERRGDTPVRIFGGLGGVFLLEELLAGATGAMTGFAFPEILVKIVSLYRAGDIDDAADVFYRAVPLMRFEFQEGIGMAIRKEVLHRRGALASPATRAPAAASIRRRAKR